MSHESSSGIAGTPSLGTRGAWFVMKAPEPPGDIPFDDGVPIESDWHRSAVNLLVEVVRYHFRDRGDFFAGGNMFLYFKSEQVRVRDFRGPDFFFSWRVQRNKKRNYYAIWEEGGYYPNIIIELLTPRSAEEDRTVKRKLYEDTFRTPEYFLFDPLTGVMEGLRLRRGRTYEPIEQDDRGWLWSEQLRLFLSPWEGECTGIRATWPRFYDTDGCLLPTVGEAEKQRADAAEAEVARLRRELEELRQRSMPSPPQQNQQ